MNILRDFKKLLAPSILALLTLAGCGGGDPVAPIKPVVTAPQTCYNGANDFPTCGDLLVFQPAALQEAKPTNYPAGSNELEFITELNAMRTSMGLGPLNHHPALDLSAANHAAYHNANIGMVPNFHVEEFGRPSFTGVTYFDRIKFAGYPIVSGSETGSPDIGKHAFEILADTVLHRQSMMDEGFTHVGMISTERNGTITNYANNLPQKNSSHFVGVYPVDGQTGVPLNHYLESPNPFHDLEMTLENMCAKTGFPISLQSSISTALSVKSFTLQEVGQAFTLPVRLLSYPGHDGIRLNTAFIVAHTGLKPNTQYEVKFAGTARQIGRIDFLNIEKTWRFTTASKTLLIGCAPS